MSLRVMFDASRPPNKPYPNSHAVAGYIGGNTPHVWTRDEWNAASVNGRLRMLPIWVGFHEDDAVTHAKEAANAARNLGWSDKLGRYICNDMETDEHDHAWCERFAARLEIEGFRCLEYRSLAAIEAEPTPKNCDNWVAEWGVTPDLTVEPRTEAFQYKDDVPYLHTAVDLSVISNICYDRLGRGKRH